MVRLDKKLVVLRAEQEAVREEGEVNEALGSRVGTRVADVASSAEASKYRLHVEEVGKITSLLLGLSGRLARVENALYGMAADHAERVSTIPAWLSNLLIHLPIPYNFGRFAILCHPVHENAPQSYKARRFLCICSKVIRRLATPVLCFSLISLSNSRPNC
jgi:hypothetical protein